MTVEFQLPDIGEGVSEVEIVRWLVQEGERVQEFDPIVEVQTDKALVELPSPQGGFIAEIRIPAGTRVRVGDVLLIIDESVAKRQTRQGEDGVQGESLAQASLQNDATEMAASLQTSGVEPVSRPRATPSVRQYADQLGISLQGVVGSGPGGRILKADVDRQAETQRALGHARRPTMRDAAASTQEDRRISSARVRDIDETDAMKSPLYAEYQRNYRRDEETDSPFQQPSTTRVPFRGVRRATAERVTRSAFTAAHVTAFEECDATELVLLRRRWNEVLAADGQRLSFLPFIIKATVSALKEYPYFNARLHEEAEEIELYPYYHVGIAVDTPDGLFVPVIKDADQLSLRELGAAIYRLSHAAKERTLTSEELRGSTFTITNMGPMGGLFVTPILNYPEVGILAIHQIQRKPVARGDEIVIRDILNVSLSFDHRVIDGATSVRFLNHIKQLIEQPERLMLDLR